MKDSLKHQKIYKTSIVGDEIHTTKNSYYNELSYTKTEIEKRVTVTRGSILMELVDCLELITNGSSRVVITIKGSNNEPVMLTKKWVSEEIQFPRTDAEVDTTQK